MHIMSKYVHKKGEIMHCPFCRGVIMRDFRLTSMQHDVSFMIRCAHCPRYVHIAVRDEGEITVEGEEENNA